MTQTAKFKTTHAQLPYDVLMSIKEPAQTAKLKRHFAFLYNFNKDPSLTAIFQKLHHFADALENKSFSYLTEDNHTFKKTHSAKSGDYTKTLPVSFNVPFLSIKKNNELNSIIKEIYQLDDKAISQVHDIFNNQLLSFIESIINIQASHSMNRCIDKDLYYLIDNSQNNELVAKINKLKNLSINYSTFDKDVEMHDQACTDVLNDFLNIKEFNENLLPVYFKIASMQNDKTPWLYKNETHAMLANLALRALIICLYEWMLVLLVTITMLVICLTPFIPFLLISNPIVASVVALGVTALIIGGLIYAATSKEMDSIPGKLKQPTIACLNFIDKMTEDRFNTQLFSTELAGTLCSVKQNQSKCVHINSQFKFFTPREKSADNNILRNENEDNNEVKYPSLNPID